MVSVFTDKTKNNLKAPLYYSAYSDIIAVCAGNFVKRCLLFDDMLLVYHQKGYKVLWRYLSFKKGIK